MLPNANAPERFVVPRAVVPPLMVRPLVPDNKPEAAIALAVNPLVMARLPAKELDAAVV